ncbi:hypothetical protein KSS87_000501 [Heliosperma pusillum]|nr:hypothetical protein KSS87_000501 [Heliosperma pusillum]
MINDEIDWNQLLNFDDGVENLDFFATATSTEVPPEIPAAAAESWMGELEELLMKDDDANNNFGSETTSNSDFIKEFDLEVCDLLLASSPSIGNGNDVLNDKEIEINHNFVSNCQNYDKSSEDDALEVNDNDNDDDPLTKKRKRQSRNREAAMRSRERKKSLVKDLEIKSRYFEDECRRLQRMLHCCYVENQWLRCSLQTYGAPITKPESAVLLLGMLYRSFLPPLFAGLNLLISIVFYAFQVNLCRGGPRISAVGFPGLVNGQHMPASSVQAAPVKSGCSITGKRGQKKSGNRKIKRKGNQDK